MATQKQALTAGLRTAAQTFQASLLVILGAGGLLGGLTDIRQVSWIALGAALAAGLLVAFFAGLNSYLNFVIGGVPSTYTAPIDAGIAQPSTPAVITSVPAVPAVEQPTQP